MSQRFKLYSERGYNRNIIIHPTAILRNIWIDCTGRVIICKNVDIADNVKIYTHAHQFHKSNWKDLPIKIIPLTIYKGVFIGVNSIILAEVETIGKHSVIGAGSVLTKSVPDYEIWAGNPARKIGEVQK